MLNKAPTHYGLKPLVDQINKNENMTCSPDRNIWYPARPMGFFSLRNRFKYAWMVFTGKADIVTWPGGQ